MDASCFCKLNCFLHFSWFSVFCAQMCAQRALPAALWRAGLLLSFLCLCACLGEDCVVGIVGRPVSLPCIYPGLLPLENASIEWWREDEVVLRSGWKEDGDMVTWSINSATVSADAALTGNLSLHLPAVDTTDDNGHYSLFVISGGNHSTLWCTVCLRMAARFSFPHLQRQEAAEGDETAFLCHSSGGYPQPAVYWLINDTEEPPEGSVRTLAASLPDSHLYNVTSRLTVNISKDSSVSCTIENPSMNETLTSTSHGVDHVTSRASEGMWIFSLGLCVVVGLMVMAGVIYQIHLDRISKKKKKEYQREVRGYKRHRLDSGETEVVKLESKETDV